MRAPPVMCIVLTCELLWVPLDATLPTACALEMVHAASLIHEDLLCMDAVSLCWGCPTDHAHAVFRDDMAELTGDALLPRASASHIFSRTLSEVVPEERLLLVVEEIAQVVGSTGMAAG
ncbi:hypothetical protein Taro_052845 [Colocasia esculenta]|uniref:Secreted protein n=1 Tax=Colocasia esculenta TaxID=4460 RepID=A0A843XKW0_COLES|nr:hypothetical protein [Colocasia esculenta]